VHSSSSFPLLSLYSCTALPSPLQVGLAVELRKPLFMHCRDAGDKFAEVLGRHSLAGLPAVLHCFTGNGTELAHCLQLGLSIGITGWVCDDRPERGGAELAVGGGLRGASWHCGLVGVL
jgi:hypothetical protein